MNRNMTKNKYSGQALAIAMLILVVSSLIGLAMYSRTTKDKTLTLEERASGEALEVSDVILNNITSFTVEEIAMKLNEYYYEEGDSFDLTDEVVLYENSGEDDITLLFRSLGLLADNEKFSETLDPLCPVSILPNEYQLTIQKTSPDIGYELRPGHIWSFPTWKLIIPFDPNAEERSCILRLKISEIGDPLAGFVLTKLYCEYNQQTDLVQSCTDIENEYEMVNYRFGTSSGETYSGFLDDHWTGISPGETIEFSLKEDGVKAIPTEIRIKALGRLGSPGIKISYELEGDCGIDVNMYLVRATANCSGVYRGKEIVVPQKGHNLLFDYVYFKGL